jgi:hypothetical protein
MGGSQERRVQVRQLFGVGNCLARFSGLLFAPGFSRRDLGHSYSPHSALQRGFSKCFSMGGAKPEGTPLRGAEADESTLKRAEQS